MAQAENRESLFADSDYEALIDDKEYMKTEMNALEEQVINNPSQYTMSFDDYKKKEDKEEQKAISAAEVANLKQKEIEEK